jgi:cytoskeletal protein CcmA (bactofilin family)
MFTKDDKQLETIIGNNTQLDGNISTKGTIKVDGRINGSIETDWIILGEKSYMKGNIIASGVVVAGYVEGNITAKEVIEIKRSGQVRGDIATSKLVVIEGGYVDGQVSMKKDGSKVVELKDMVKEGVSQ